MEDPEFEDVDNIDSVFSGFDKKNKKLTKKSGKNKSKKKHPKKPCPLKCEKGTHSNGSLYFCPLFRDKLKEDRKLIQEKVHVCLKFLAKVSKGHDCPIENCDNCGAAHNILMCMKDQEECEKTYLASGGTEKLRSQILKMTQIILITQKTRCF